MYPKVLYTKIQNVRDTVDKRVVQTTALDVRTPSCPNAFAITYQVGVEQAPSITISAISFWSANPR